MPQIHQLNTNCDHYHNEDLVEWDNIDILLVWTFVHPTDKFHVSLSNTSVFVTYLIPHRAAKMQGNF